MFVDRRIVSLWVLVAGSLACVPVLADDAPLAAISALADRGIIKDAERWEKDLVAGTKIPGDQAAALLVDLAKFYKPTATIDEAIAVLTERGAIGSQDYWKQNTRGGRACDGKLLGVVLSRVATSLPIPAPKSFKADPLPVAEPSTWKDSYDVVVAGAGTGGCGAAVQAARMGRSVLLLEETDWIGGQMCAAAVTSMDEGGQQVRQRGLYHELCGLIQAHYEPLGINPYTAYWHHSPGVEPRVGRNLLLKMLGDARGAGVLDLGLRSRVTKVNMTGKAVTGVDVATWNGKATATRRVSCKVLIDATEWGDVIPLTGVRYRAGNCTSDSIDASKKIQFLTWTAVVKQYPQGVPQQLQLTAPPPDYASHLKAFRRSLQLGTPEDRNRPPKGTPWSWVYFIGYRGMPDGTRPPAGRAITRTHLNYNNDYPVTVADLEDPTSRLATCRKALRKTLCLLYYLQTELGQRDWSVADDEGFDSPYNRAQMDELIATQPELAPYLPVLYHFSIMPYVRESRRIVGEHTLTAKEIERKPGPPVQFADTVTLGDYAVDLHGSMAPEWLELDLDRREDIPSDFGSAGTGPFAIPLGSFLPVDIDGFLPAEKNLSQSRLANGATRLQPSTLNMGQAVGALAALAISAGVPPRKVDPVDVQRVLLDAGAALAITPVRAARGTEQWRQQQWEALRAAKSGS